MTSLTSLTSLNSLTSLAGIVSLALLGSIHFLRNPGTKIAAPPARLPAASKTETPKGLAATDWSSIQAAHESGRHNIVPFDKGWRAKNPGQGWITSFNHLGFTTTPESGGWTWGLDLQGYGWGTTQPVASPLATTITDGSLSRKWDTCLTEWYINDTRGLEHGFTVASRPRSTTEPLILELAVRGGLLPLVSETGGSVSFVNSQGGTALNYNGLTVFDAAGHTVSARWYVIGTDRLHLQVDDADANYPLTIDPIAQQAYLKASNTGQSDFFGCSVAVSGNTVVVGAYNEDSSATGVNGDQFNNLSSNSGAAYVFVRSGSTWTQQAYLKASNTGNGDDFGRQVAISGDTIVVTAPQESSNATGVNGDQTNNSAGASGAAYVFVRNGTTWTQQAYLKASNTEATDNFGFSVSLSGDTAVVGTFSEDSNATGVNGDQLNNSASGSGAAYVFVRNGTTWSQQAYLKASNTDSSDSFAIALYISGDTIVVGAPGEDSNATGVNGSQSNNFNGNFGAAYVFVRNGTTWSQQAYLKASNTGVNDEFGASVAVSADTIVVGAPREDSSATGVNGDQSINTMSSAGAAYVFVRNGTTWSQQAYLKASNPAANDEFGLPVSISVDTIVVVSRGEDSVASGVNGNQADNSAPDSGAAYVFVRTGGVWSQHAYVKASNTESLDQFGISIAISGETLVAGTIDEDSNATGVNGNQSNNSLGGAGAAYVFDLDNNPGTSSYGTGTPGCAGPHTLDVTHAPMIGSPNWAITCTNAPPLSLGLGLVTDSQDLAGSDVFGLGVLLHSDLIFATEVISLDFFSDATGYSETVGASIPNEPLLIGKTYFASALWAWTTCSLPPFNLSSSNGLAITILAP